MGRFVRYVIGVVLLAAVSASGPASAQEQQGPRPAQIDRNGVLILIRTTLLALDQGNKTGNYTVLRDIGAPGFQANTAARLAEIFAKLRNDKLDLSGVAVIEPQLSLLPQIETNGLMRMAGFFPSVPAQVNFELAFAPVDGQWRLFGISVGVGSSAPVAPQAPPPQVSNPSPPPAAPKQAPNAQKRDTPPAAARNQAPLPKRQLKQQPNE
jgi:hypothetical protein